LPERVLVTGALGCLGTWTIKALLDSGDQPVGLDLGADRSRLSLVLGRAADDVPLVRADVTDADALGRVLDEQRVTRVIHLAALQVPASAADPALGARVNVLGTVNVFEAIRSRLDRIPIVAYASSAAVYAPEDPSPAPESGGAAPRTLYGVWKLANEGTARVFWQDARLPSFGIRPYVVFGPGRDQGLTSGPSLAMAAAARGESFRIGYGGRAQYDFAPDVGRAFARAAHAATDGAIVANFPGEAASVQEIVASIAIAAPESEGRITWTGDKLPFPEELEAKALERALGPLETTPIADAVQATVAHHSRGLSATGYRPAR
jgi:UDP-glucuronate 4-epimerase